MKSKALTWKQVQDTFPEDQRHYDGKYLVVDYVLNNAVEVSYFRSEQPGQKDEIYINFDIMFGIVYPGDRDVQELLQNIKTDIQKEYVKNKGKASGEFINYFGDTYEIHIPGNTFFAVDKEAYENADEDTKVFLDMLMQDLF